MADWDALARHVIDRRVKLGHHSREAFAQASGISVRTLGDIESARRPSYAPETLVRLERALNWPAGHINEILGPAIAPDHYLINEATGERFLPSMRPVPPGLQDLAWLLEDDSPLPADDRADLQAAVNALVRMAMRRARKARQDDDPVVHRPEAATPTG